MDIEQLKEDIEDAKIVKDQAHKDMIDAQKWYRSRCDRLSELQTALEIEKSK